MAKCVYHTDAGIACALAAARLGMQQHRGSVCTHACMQPVHGHKSQTVSLSCQGEYCHTPGGTDVWGDAPAKTNSDRFDRSNASSSIAAALEAASQRPWRLRKEGHAVLVPTNCSLL